MRANTFFHSSGLCIALNTRCSVWQPTQSGRNDLTGSAPGAIMIHSPLESWPWMLFALASLTSVLAGLPAATSICFGPAST